MRLLISVILSRIFRFRFLYLGQMFYLSILFTRMMCDLKASEKRKELKPEIVNSTNRTYSKSRKRMPGVLLLMLVQQHT